MVNPNILFYGAGAIGSTLGGWLSEHYENVYVLARGENAEVMKSKGLTLYEIDKTKSKTIPLKIITNLNNLKQVDIIVITVKNYDLEEVAKDIYEKLGDKPIIVGLQNGIENQKILPKYFSKIIYGVIVCSAWYDEPGIFGNRGKGQILLGTINNENQEILEQVRDILALGFPTKITKRYNDAAHSKLILNIINSIFTIINKENLTIDDKFKIWKIFVSSFLEGVEVLKKAGYREQKLKGLPSWRTIEFAQNLEKKMALDSFEESMKFSWLNSMAQDMVLLKRQKSEIDTLNGYFIELADKFKLEVPVNRTLYDLCKKQFNKVPFKPLHVNIVWNKLNENLKEKLKLE